MSISGSARKALTIGSLFAGIGGFDLAARWMGWETKWFSEIEPYASAVLKKHWPNVPNHGDITKIKGADVEYVDILCGGFPCQDISLAGKGEGLEGKRSGLWFEYARLIEEIRPRYVVAENVSALRSRGLDQVLGSLAALGYDAEWHCIPASSVGAPHRRDRIWIVAYPSGSGRGEECALSGRRQSGSGTEGSEGYRPVLSSSPVADALGVGSNERFCCFSSSAPGESGLRDETGAGRSTLAHAFCKRGRCGAPRRKDAENAGQPSRGPREWSWDSEPAVGRVVDGLPFRVDRLRCLGNALVPQIPYLIFQAIERRELSHTNSHTSA